MVEHVAAAQAHARGGIQRVHPANVAKILPCLRPASITQWVKRGQQCNDPTGKGTSGLGWPATFNASWEPDKHSS